MATHIFLLLLGGTLLTPPSGSKADILNCPFEDTVNLTASIKFTNGSYIYEGLLVPPQFIGEYDYIELFEGKRQKVDKHTRGCVCKLKQCIRFCCHPRADMFQSSENASPQCDNEQLSEEPKYTPFINVTLRNNSRVTMHVLEEFVVQQGTPCADVYPLMPHVFDEDKWELFENGTLLRNRDYLSRRDYCLQAHNFSGEFVLNPMNCAIMYEEPPTMMFNTKIMMISAPFLYATILIYWLIPELWNLHTKCLISYLLSLALGTSMIVVVNIQNSDFEDLTCSIIGFITYFFLTAVFFWLNVICFDLWQNFRRAKGGAQHLSQRNRFLYYSLYAWGLPSIMTIATAMLQNSKLPYGLKSGIGHTHCWLKVDDWSAMIYFYGPCLLLIIFNISIFFLTAKKIYSIRKELQHFSRGEDSRRHLRSQQNNAWLFFRMFIVMGVGWLLEIISYMFGNNNKLQFFFAITDIYNASQGIIIFILLVMKKKVLLLIKKRYLIKKIAPIFVFLLLRICKTDNKQQFSSRRFAKSSTSAVELSNTEFRWKPRN